MNLLQKLDLESGDVLFDYVDSASRCLQVIPNPADPDRLLLLRDYPPLYDLGGNRGKNPRAFILQVSSRTLIPVRTKNASQFHTQVDWSPDGSMVYYTGVGGITEKGAKGAFVGVANSSGTSVWEQAIPGYANFRGQVFSHPTQPLIMLLNVVDEDLLVAKDWNLTDVNRFATTQIYGRPGVPAKI